MMRTIFFDLDGTLIDTSERHYRVYKDILQSFGVPNILSKQEYWNHKRNGRKTIELLADNCSEEVVRKFVDEWLKRIEDNNYLTYDDLLPETLRVLSVLKEKAELMLVTLRNNKENVFRQLVNFGLTNYFREILVGSPLKLENKIPLVKDYIEENPKSDDFIFVGDSEVDISTGRQLGILTAAVTYGIRSRKFMEKLKPDFYFDNLSEIVKIFERTGSN